MKQAVTARDSLFQRWGGTQISFQHFNGQRIQVPAVASLPDQTAYFMTGVEQTPGDSGTDKSVRPRNQRFRHLRSLFISRVEAGRNKSGLIFAASDRSLRPQV